MSRAASRLRATRAAPPGRAARDDERRNIFSAALQQSEDLFDAAAAVGPFARPLPLFYAVSQAGRAVAAARAEHDWRVSGHGLTEDGNHNRPRTKSILGFRIKPHAKPGVFGAVASTFGLPGLTDSVELGALWSALPGLSPPNGGSWSLSLPVWPQVYSQGVVFHIGASHRGHVSLREQSPPDDAPAINALLANYPAAEGAQVEVVQTVIQQAQTPWGFGVPIRWPEPSVEHPPTGPPPPEFVASQIHNRVPQYRYQREHWLIPRVGEGADELPALLVWWVLLFGLSLLARYEPAAWRTALDPDQSELAVPLEELLDEALIVAPDLLSEAITQQAALLPPRV